MLCCNSQVHHSVAHVALDTLVEERLAAIRKVSWLGCAPQCAYPASESRPRQATDGLSTSVVCVLQKRRHEMRWSRCCGSAALTFAGAAEQGGKGAAGRAERDMMRTTVLEDAAIVCSTLSFSGSGAFGRMARPFDVVIIDEAAQAVEPSILIPLTAGCKQVSLKCIG